MATLAQLGEIGKAGEEQKRDRRALAGAGAVLGGTGLVSVPTTVRTDSLVPPGKTSTYTGIGDRTGLFSEAGKFHDTGRTGARGVKMGNKFITRGALASRVGGGALIAGGLGTIAAANKRRKAARGAGG